MLHTEIEKLGGARDEATPNQDAYLTSTLCLFDTADDLSNIVIPQTIAFPLGSVAGERRCINIPINDDNLIEDVENFFVSASSTDPNVEFTPGLDQTVVSIIDNDGKK